MASDRALVQELLCPISHSLCTSPVLAEDGFVYEQGPIQQWLARSRTSPLTRERMGAKLFEADAHLGFARLRLDRGDKDDARAHLGKARTLIDDCGYYRRDRDLAELDALLN